MGVLKALCVARAPPRQLLPMHSAQMDRNRLFVDQRCLQSKTHQRGRLEDELAKVQQT